MSGRPLRRVMDPVLALPVRRPVVTLLLAAALMVLAVFGISRLRPDTSLQALFAEDDPAADAMVRVLNGYGAVEELLVLVSVPDTPAFSAGAEPSRLVAFARRFEDALLSSADAPKLVDAVMYRADADTRRFVEEVLAPAGIFYLDDAAFARARQRLTPEGMREQLKRNEALLSQPGPAAAAAAKALLQDPLRLHEFLKPKLAAVGSFTTFQGSDALLSADGRALLVRVIGKRPPSDLTFARQLVAAATRAAEAANVDGLDVSLGGAYAIATTSERSLRADSIQCVTGALAGLIALFAIVYRRPLRLLLLAIGPLVLGSLLGFGAFAVVERSMTILSAAVGAMMVGMGIDYSVHYLTHYEKTRGAGQDAASATRHTSGELFAPLMAAWITSLIGFTVVGTSDIPALGTFALLGALGLTGVFLTSLTVVPALLVLIDRNGRRQASRTRLRFSLDPLLGWIARHARACIVCSLVVFGLGVGVGVFLPGPILALESDLTVMHPRPNPALETQDEIARRFGSVPGSIIVHLRAQTPDQLMRLAHQVDQRLLRSPDARKAGIVGTIGLANVLPDPAVVERRLTDVDSISADQVVADFRAALADSVFDPAKFEPYAAFLHQLLARRDAPTLADLLKYRRLAQSFLPSAALEAGAAPPSEAITLVSLSGSIDERSRRAAAVNAARAALADLPQATVTGLSVLGHDAEASVARTIPPLFGIAAGLVLLWVLIHFRSIRDAMLSLTTSCFGLIMLLAGMRLAGVRLNMINLIGLPLLIGMTVDYGIFLVSLARLGRQQGSSPDALREHLASSAQSVLVCAGTTVLGFASLSLTSVPAVRSLGMVVVIGMTAALAGALFLLVPMLLIGSSRRSETGQAASPAPISVSESL